MSGAFDGFYTAVSGMQTYNIALTTTAHNIANIGTKGYSKQTVDQKATTIGGYASRITGSGATVTGIGIERSAYYDIKYRNTNSLTSSYDTKAYYLQCMNDYMYTLDRKSGGFTNAFDQFFTTVSGLTDATSDSLRTQVISYAENLTSEIRDLAVGLQTLQSEANAEIKVTVDKINSIATQIASVTKQINTSELYGGIANDLRDQRNVLLDELSAFVEVEVIEKPLESGKFNQYMVFINGVTLLDNENVRQLVLTEREYKKNINDLEGLYEVEWSTGERFLTDVVGRAGTLQALFTMRDGNNSEALKGDITEITSVPADPADPAGMQKATIVLKNTNINDGNKLNISPSDGIITINGGEYAYESFKVEVEADGSFTYSFTLKKEMTSTQINNVQTLITRGATSTVGADVDFKGIPYAMAQLNEFVRTFSEQYNIVHNAGYDYNGDAGIDFFNMQNAVDKGNYILSEKVDGKDLSFSSLAGKNANGEYVGVYYHMTCLNFYVAEEAVKEPRKIATSNSPDTGRGNHENVNLLADVKNKANMFSHGAPDSFLQAMVSVIGVEGAKAQSLAKSQANIRYSVDSRRSSVSGVDEDEEANDLVRFQSLLQNQYKVLSVMNEILNKLINDTGVG